ncbi:LysR family transcriptional regulator [Metasolibacillus sp.]|uniref:LysR family transcriptional regulator n=1 Tax=Metasolibacillus sp. TaxID=2703680 RepID=UPI0026009BA2|nr:LysR family transcriptional regulator [Metasolibacillus sp.]MCT6925102.1 LysR family transcriptional regulator [Metasolibacillus sp.]MCT6941306.1 LysR family transcriptional regulator [Metasolibacillus sp.]
MEIQQLHYFKLVATLQHMTQAAEQLNISQPALSKSIANIEQELGVPLFDRQGRSIFLNRYGALFLESVDIILAEHSKVMQEFAEITRPGYGEVSFGFIHTLGMEVVPDLMARTSERYPHMQFTLTQSTSLRLLKLLEDGDIDLCLSQKIESKLLDINWVELWTEELFVIVPENHPLAEREYIQLVEIKDDPFISIKRGNSLRQMVDTLFESVGVTTNTTFSAEEMHTVAGFVGSGLGVSLIPNIKGLDQFNVKKLRISEPACFRKIGLSWVKNRYISPAANDFKDFLIETLIKEQNK